MSKLLVRLVMGLMVGDTTPHNTTINMLIG